MPAGANDTPDSVRVLQRKLYRAAKQSRSRRFHALFDKVYRRDVLERAFDEVDIAVQEIDSEPIAQVILDARWRGVDVDMFIEQDYIRSTL